MKEKIMTLVRSEKFGEFVRFGIVGVIATVIHYSIYYLLLRMGWNPTASLTIGYFLSWLANLFMSAKFTFKKKATAKRSIGFAMSHGINWSMQVVFLNLFIYLGVPKEFALIPVYCICVPLNFLMVRFVFNR